MKARLVTQNWYSAINKKVGDITEFKGAKLFIRNTSKREIKVPQWLCEGYANDSITEIYLEILQRVESGDLVKAEMTNADIDYLTLGRKFVTIKPRKETEFEIQLDLTYKLGAKGKYKVRAILLDRFTNCQDIATPWQEFEIR